MLVAAARALADVVTPDEIGPNYIIPSVFHPDVASAVAAAVREAASGPHPGAAHSLGPGSSAPHPAAAHSLGPGSSALGQKC
jgi:hypothetical protein